ncbi:hypothetical protein E2C01_034957 [Portunus trituberculatus]|uniref:Uncharacterized protein n=1 Tax=Portunus trituberculatus TaxID=210409 RepID=A0A5B7F8C6_PORTR|nr:hypothetical protein [Portunus trituberculatus]
MPLWRPAAVSVRPPNHLEPTPLADSSLEQLAEDSRRELEEVYRGVVTREELARIDMQPNPFNYSDRVSQTTPNPTKVMQHKHKPHHERRLKTF